MKFKKYCVIIPLLIGVQLTSAQTADDFIGNWATQDGLAIIKLDRCSLYRGGPLTAMCAHVVWDKDAVEPNSKKPHDCYKLVGQFGKFVGSSWVDGVSYDPRSNKTYRAKLTLIAGKLNLRSFIGNEMFGETETFARAINVPNNCELTKNPSLNKL